MLYLLEVVFGDLAEGVDGPTVMIVDGPFPPTVVITLFFPVKDALNLIDMVYEYFTRHSCIRYCFVFFYQ